MPKKTKVGFLQEPKKLTFPLLREVMTFYQIWPTNTRAPPLRCIILSTYVFGLLVPMVCFTIFKHLKFIQFNMNV